MGRFQGCCAVSAKVLTLSGHGLPPNPPGAPGGHLNLRVHTRLPLPPAKRQGSKGRAGPRRALTRLLPPRPRHPHVGSPRLALRRDQLGGLSRRICHPSSCRAGGGAGWGLGTREKSVRGELRLRRPAAGPGGGPPRMRGTPGPPRRRGPHVPPGAGAAGRP